MPAAGRFRVGGSAAIAQALTADIEAHGGVVETGGPDRLPRGAAAGPGHAAGRGAARRCSGWRRAGSPTRYRRALESFRFGNAACKVDFILSGPVPWAAPGLADAGTVHVGGTRAEMAEAENLVAAGRHPDRPYVLVSQPSRFDAGRAPAGRHILWSYCHVPAGSTVDMGEAVIAQLERFAPGFRDLVVQYKVTTAAGLAGIQRKLRRRGLRRRTAWTSGAFSGGPSWAPCRGGRRCPACTCAPPPPRPVPA